MKGALLLVLLLGWANVAMAVDEELPVMCRTQPRLIVPDSNEPRVSESTAMPPVGIVVLEATVTTDGTIRDVRVVGTVAPRLRQWALEKSEGMKFEPVRQPCRARFTLESRISSG